MVDQTAVVEIKTTGEKRAVSSPKELRGPGKRERFLISLIGRGSKDPEKIFSTIAGGSSLGHSEERGRDEGNLDLTKTRLLPRLYDAAPLVVSEEIEKVDNVLLPDVLKTLDSLPLDLRDLHFFPYANFLKEFRAAKGDQLKQKELVISAMVESFMQGRERDETTQRAFRIAKRRMAIATNYLRSVGRLKSDLPEREIEALAVKYLRLSEDKTFSLTGLQDYYLDFTKLHDASFDPFQEILSIDHSIAVMADVLQLSPFERKMDGVRIKYTPGALGGGSLVWFGLWPTEISLPPGKTFIRDHEIAHMLIHDWIPLVARSNYSRNRIVGKGGVYWYESMANYLAHRVRMPKGIILEFHSLIQGRWRESQDKGRTVDDFRNSLDHSYRQLLKQFSFTDRYRGGERLRFSASNLLIDSLLIRKGGIDMVKAVTKTPLLYAPGWHFDEVVERVIGRTPGETLEEMIKSCSPVRSGGEETDLEKPSPQPYDYSVIRDVLRVRRETRKKKGERSFDKWARSKSGIESYGFYFNELLPRRMTLKELIEKKKKEKGVIRALDLMSYGAALRDASLQGCAVGLRDARNIWERVKDKQMGIKLIVGDILSPQSWREIDNYLSRQGEGVRFDFIFCRPIRGLEKIPQNPGLYYALLKRVYRVLDSDGGIFLTQFPTELTSMVRKVCEQLEATEGTEARYRTDKLTEAVFPTDSFLLIKHSEAPKELPRLEGI